MDLVSYWGVSFSGSRHLDQPEAVRAQIREALRKLKESTDGQLVAISSVAIGADLLFIEEVLGFGLPWMAILPFPENQFFNEKDFPDASERESARQKLSRAAGCEIIRVPGDPDGAANSVWRHTAFADAGFKCVDEADVLIAVLHETDESGKPGGTSEVVAYARTCKRPILIIDPETLRVTSENWPARLHDPLTERLRLLGGVPLAPQGQDECSFASAVALAGWRNGFARAARRHVPSIRWGTTAVVILHALATIITAAIFVLILPRQFNHEHVTSFALEMIAFVFVLGGFGFLTWLILKQPQVKAADYRFAAEIGRSFLAVWNIRGAALRILRSPPKKFAHFVRSLLWYYRLEADSHLRPLGAILSEKNVRESAVRYIQGRIDSQIEYYSEKRLKSHRAALALQICSIAFSIIAVISAGILVLGQLSEFSRGWWGFAKLFVVFGQLSEPSRAWWGFAKLSAATAAPLAFSMLVIHEVKRRETRYLEMQHILKEYAQRMHHARSLSSLVDLVVDAEHLLISETYEWWILAKENVAA